MRAHVGISLWAVDSTTSDSKSYLTTIDGGMGAHPILFDFFPYVFVKYAI